MMSGDVSDTGLCFRYPSFVDALRDADDCVSMCALFATFPKSNRCHIEFIHLCKRLAGGLSLTII